MECSRHQQSTRADLDSTQEQTYPFYPHHNPLVTDPVGSLNWKPWFLRSTRLCDYSPALLILLCNRPTRFQIKYDLNSFISLSVKFQRQAQSYKLESTSHSLILIFPWYGLGHCFNNGLDRHQVIWLKWMTIVNGSSAVKAVQWDWWNHTFVSRD